jgi:hypothetical protein
MAYLANIAVQNQCAGFEWMVLDWNERLSGVYKKLRRGCDSIMKASSSARLPPWACCTQADRSNGLREVVISED